MSIRDDAIYEPFTKLLKAVADPSRRHILMALRHSGELSVNDIASMVNLSQPLASQHLRILKEAEAIQARKVGQQVYYSLVSIPLCDALTDLLALYQQELKKFRSQIHD